MDTLVDVLTDLIGFMEGAWIWCRPEEVRMLLVLSAEGNVCVSNTWFKRGKEEGDIQNG